MQLQKDKKRAFFQPLSDFFFNSQSPILAYGIATLIAIFFVLWIYPLSFLAGHGAYFEQGDASQHVTGWLFYAQDTWHFPLLRTERLNHPAGAVIAFTDSIPLAALLFKSIASWLPPHFHYIGLWHVVVFVTQAIGATFLIRSLGARHNLATLSAVIFALSWPALLWRIGHTSLMTHSIILFALAFYFLGRQGRWRANRTTAAFIAVSLIGLTVHPYFLAFCYTLFLSFLADQAIAGEGWKKQIPRLLASVFVISAVGALLGYFGNGTVTFGFGYYSMNLTAPFCGSRFYSCVSDAANQPFQAFNFVDATGGQYEGFNYFGAGLILLLPFAVVTNWSAIKALPRQYPALLLALLLCTLYALSNKVYLGTHELISYPLPFFMDRLTGTFRASGRFFWLVGYLVLFSVLAALLKKPSWRSVVLVGVALTLQWVDMQPLRENIMHTAAKPGTNDLAPWGKVLTNVDKIHIYPAFGCGNSDVKIYWFFQRVAAHYGKLLDTGYIARPNVNCANNDKAFDKDFEPRHLYIMSADFLKTPFKIPKGFSNAALHNACIKSQNAVLCQSGYSAEQWKNTGLQETEPVILQSSNKAEWLADALPTQIGKVVHSRLVPGDKRKAGFLSYGPYVTLPSGRYRYAITYSSDSETTRQVGHWDVVIGNGNGGTRELATGTLDGTVGKEQRIEGIFNVEDPNAPVEIRTIFKGTGDLQLTSISLEIAP